MGPLILRFGYFIEFAVLFVSYQLLMTGLSYAQEVEQSTGRYDSVMVDLRVAIGSQALVQLASCPTNEVCNVVSNGLVLTYFIIGESLSVSVSTMDGGNPLVGSARQKYFVVPIDDVSRTFELFDDLSTDPLSAIGRVTISNSNLK